MQFNAAGEKSWPVRDYLPLPTGGATASSWMTVRSCCASFSRAAIWSRRGDRTSAYFTRFEHNDAIRDMSAKRIDHIVVLQSEAH